MNRKTGSKGLRQILVEATLNSLAIRIMQAVLGLAISVLLARSIGADGVGEYASLLAIIQMAIIPIQSGVGSFLGRHVARMRAAGNHNEVSSVIHWSALATLCYLIVVVAVAIGLVLLGVVERPILVVFSILAITMLCAGRIATAVLTGYRKVVAAQSYDLIRNLLIVTCILTATLLQKDITIEATLRFFIGALALSTVLHISRTAIFVPTPLPSGFTMLQNKTWVKASAIFILINGVFRVTDQSGILFVRWFSSTREAGIYQSAYQLSSLLLFGLTAVTLAIMPFVTELYEKGDSTGLQKIARRASQASFLFALTSFVIITFFGRYVIVLLFGEDFLTAWPILMCICGGYLINSSTGASGSLLSATGHEGKLLKVALGSLAVVTVFCYFLVPMYGGLGAGISISVALLFSNICQWALVRRYLHIDPFFLPIKWLDERL